MEIRRKTKYKAELGNITDTPNMTEQCVNKVARLHTKLDR
jgi:hypothetical protein